VIHIEQADGRGVGFDTLIHWRTAKKARNIVEMGKLMQQMERNNPDLLEHRLYHRMVCECVEQGDLNAFNEWWTKMRKHKDRQL